MTARRPAPAELPCILGRAPKRLKSGWIWETAAIAIESRPLESGAWQVRMWVWGSPVAKHFVGSAAKGARWADAKLRRLAAELVEPPAAPPVKWLKNHPWRRRKGGRP